MTLKYRDQFTRLDWKSSKIISRSVSLGYTLSQQTPTSRIYSKWNSLQFAPKVFGSRVGFLGSADQMALIPVRSYPGWQPAAILENYSGIERFPSTARLSCLICFYINCVCDITNWSVFSFSFSCRKISLLPHAWEWDIRRRRRSFGCCCCCWLKMRQLTRHWRMLGVIISHHVQAVNLRSEFPDRWPFKLPHRRALSWRIFVSCEWPRSMAYISHQRQFVVCSVTSSHLCSV